jgi:hypothetical protein
MVGGSRIVGILLVVGALVVALGVVLWFVSAYSEGQLSQGGMSLGVALLLLVLAPIVAVGAYLMGLGGR